MLRCSKYNTMIHKLHTISHSTWGYVCIFTTYHYLSSLMLVYPLESTNCEIKIKNVATEHHQIQ